MIRVVVKDFTSGDERTIELSHGANGLDLLDRLGLPVDGTLLLRGGDPIPEDTHLIDGERLTVIRVASGG